MLLVYVTRSRHLSISLAKCLGQKNSKHFLGKNASDFPDVVNSASEVWAVRILMVNANLLGCGIPRNLTRVAAPSEEKLVKKPY